MIPPRLDGCRVLLTRPTEQADAWQTALSESGAVVVPFPTTRVGPPRSFAALDAALGHAADYDWLVFTSGNAVRYFCERWLAFGAPPLRAQIAAVGQRTQHALAAHGFAAAFVPTDQRAEGLVEHLSQLPEGSRVLFPRAVAGRELLPQALQARGVHVDVVAASETTPISPLPPVPPFDVATFASPSALSAFVDGAGLAPLLDRAIVVIGPTTAQAALALGLKPTVAESPAVGAVLNAIAEISDKSPVRPGGP